MGTEDNPRFVTRDKVIPGIAYLKSQSMRNAPDWDTAVGSSSPQVSKRLQNMKRQTERAGGNGLFYFTTLDNIQPETSIH